MVWVSFLIQIVESPPVRLRICFHLLFLISLGVASLFSKHVFYTKLKFVLFVGVFFVWFLFWFLNYVQILMAYPPKAGCYLGQSFLFACWLCQGSWYRNMCERSLEAKAAISYRGLYQRTCSTTRCFTCSRQWSFPFKARVDLPCSSNQERWKEENKSQSCFQELFLVTRHKQMHLSACCFLYWF